jgi:hypothetical protein
MLPGIIYMFVVLKIRHLSLRYALNKLSLTRRYIILIVLLLTYEMWIHIRHKYSYYSAKVQRILILHLS